MKSVATCRADRFVQEGSVPLGLAAPACWLWNPLWHVRSGLGQRFQRVSHPHQPPREPPFAVGASLNRRYESPSPRSGRPCTRRHRGAARRSRLVYRVINGLAVFKMIGQGKGGGVEGAKDDFRVGIVGPKVRKIDVPEHPRLGGPRLEQDQRFPGEPCCAASQWPGPVRCSAKRRCPARLEWRPRERPPRCRNDKRRCPGCRRG